MECKPLLPEYSNPYFQLHKLEGTSELHAFQGPLGQVSRKSGGSGGVDSSKGLRGLRIYYFFPSQFGPEK